MYSYLAYLILGFALTLLGGWLFTNAAEYISYRYRLGGSFVGAVISPILTSMPELVVFLVALIAYGGREGVDVAVGTVIGEPFVVSTVIYPIIFLIALVGFLMGYRDDLVLEVDKTLIIPFAAVTALFPTVLLPAVLKSTIVVKGLVSLGLASLYLLYMYLMRRRQGLIIEDAEGLYVKRVLNINEGASLVIQLAASVTMLYLGSRVMVWNIIELSRLLLKDVMALSIIVIPTATVLPESVTAAIWTLRGRDTLAVSALVGEKVLYSTIYPALMLLSTSWSLNIDAVLCVLVVEAVSAAMLYHVYRGRLTWDVSVIGLIGYASYLALALM